MFMAGFFGTFSLPVERVGSIFGFSTIRRVDVASAFDAEEWECDLHGVRSKGGGVYVGVGAEFCVSLFFWSWFRFFVGTNRVPRLLCPSRVGRVVDHWFSVPIRVLYMGFRAFSCVESGFVGSGGSLFYARFQWLVGSFAHYRFGRVSSFPFKEIVEWEVGFLLVFFWYAFVVVCFFCGFDRVGVVVCVQRGGFPFFFFLIRVVNRFGAAAYIGEPVSLFFSEQIRFAVRELFFWFFRGIRPSIL